MYVVVLVVTGRVTIFPKLDRTFDKVKKIRRDCIANVTRITLSAAHRDSRDLGLVGTGYSGYLS
jgi:hypothetical protein